MNEKFIKTTKRLTDKECRRFKAEWHKRYAGKEYQYTPFEAKMYLPIEPTGFLASIKQRFFS